VFGFSFSFILCCSTSLFKSCCDGMHWLGYDLGLLGRLGRIHLFTFVMTVLVNYLAYVETDTPKYSFLCPH
jgi:hypothetical protein